MFAFTAASGLVSAKAEVLGPWGMNAEMRKILTFDCAITLYFLMSMIKVIEKKEMENTPTKDDCDFYQQDAHVLNRSFMKSINENLCKHEKNRYLDEESCMLKTACKYK